MSARLRAETCGVLLLVTSVLAILLLFSMVLEPRQPPQPLVGSVIASYPDEVNKLWMKRNRFRLTGSVHDCQDCFFNSNCFDAKNNPWHPLACGGGGVRHYGGGDVPNNCLNNMAVIFVGDSRARMVFLHLIETLGGKDRIAMHQFGDPHMQDYETYEPLMPWMFIINVTSRIPRQRSYFRAHDRSALPGQDGPTRVAYLWDPYLDLNKTRLHAEVDNMGSENVYVFILTGAWFICDVGDRQIIGSRRLLRNDPTKSIPVAEEKQFYEEQLAGITEAAISSPKVKRVFLMADFERLHLSNDKQANEVDTPRIFCIAQSNFRKYFCYNPARKKLALRDLMRDVRAAVASRWHPRVALFDSYFTLMRSYVELCQNYEQQLKELRKQGPMRSSHWTCSFDPFHPSAWLVDHVIDLFLNQLCSL